MKVRAKITRNYNPHHDLMGAAQSNLKLAIQDPTHGHFHSMGCILFSTLAIEACVNAFGVLKVENWEFLEPARPQDKIKIVFKALGVDLDTNGELWNRFAEMFQIRNKLAHGKTQIEFTVVEMPLSDWLGTRHKSPVSRLEKKISLKNAQSFYDAATSLWVLFSEKLDEDELVALNIDGWDRELLPCQ